MLATLAPPGSCCSPVDSLHSTFMPHLEPLPSGLLLHSVGQMPLNQYCTYSEEACGSAVSGRQPWLAVEPLLSILGLGGQPPKNKMPTTVIGRSCGKPCLRPAPLTCIPTAVTAMPCNQLCWRPALPTRTPTVVVLAFSARWAGASPAQQGAPSSPRWTLQRSVPGDNSAHQLVGTSCDPATMVGCIQPTWGDLGHPAQVTRSVCNTEPHRAPFA